MGGFLFSVLFARYRRPRFGNPTTLEKTLPKSRLRRMTLAANGVLLHDRSLFASFTNKDLLKKLYERRTKAKINYNQNNFSKKKCRRLNFYITFSYKTMNANFVYYFQMNWSGQKKIWWRRWRRHSSSMIGSRM